MRHRRRHLLPEPYGIIRQSWVQRQHVGADGLHDLSVAAHVTAERTHDVTAQYGQQARPDRVRGVPYRHLRGQLRGRDPVRQQSRAGREPAALEDVVGHEQHAEQHNERVRRNTYLDTEDAGAEAEGEARKHTQQQSEGHVPAAVHAVGDQSVHKARKTVDQPHDGHYKAEAGVRDAILGRKARYGKGEVLAHEIEERITDHRGDDGAILPILESFGLFGCHGHFFSFLYLVHFMWRGRDISSRRTYVFLLFYPKSFTPSRGHHLR